MEKGSGGEGHEGVGVGRGVPSPLGYGLEYSPPRKKIEIMLFKLRILVYSE